MSVENDKFPPFTSDINVCTRPDIIISALEETGKVGKYWKDKALKAEAENINLHFRNKQLEEDYADLLIQLDCVYDL